MTKETELLLTSASELETKYDNACKVLFSNKEIIAPILQFVLPEFKDLSVEEIIACIDNVSHVTYVSNNVQIPLDKAEQNSLTDHLVTYDIHFRTLNPNLSTHKIKVQLHIDLEIQNEFYVGYPLVKRGIYYAARELSEQIPIVTPTTNYGCLEKCYSIWICNEHVPKRLQNTVKSFKIKETNIIGNPRAERECYYDLMEIIFIYRTDAHLQNKDDSYSIFDYLTSVFSCDIQRISDYTGNTNQEKIKKEVITMTGLGASIRKKSEAKGKAEGRVEGELRGTFKTLNNLVNNGTITLEEAARQANLTTEEFLEKVNEILTEETLVETLV